MCVCVGARRDAICVGAAPVGVCVVRAGLYVGVGVCVA